jgi:hypothetical protein
MNSEIIQSVAYVNCNDFQYLNFMFSQKSFHYFQEYFNDETDLRVRYAYCDVKNLTITLFRLTHSISIRGCANNHIQNKLWIAVPPENLHESSVGDPAKIILTSKF